MNIRCVFGHKWKTHAVDNGFNTKFTNQDKSISRVYHTIFYKCCERCEKRDFDISDSFIGVEAELHQGISIQKARWLNGETDMTTTNKCYVADWRYFRKAGIKQTIDRVRTDPAVKELIETNPNVAAAVDQLEISLKLCEGG